jgi:O-antigen ligase
MSRHHSAMAGGYFLRISILVLLAAGPFLAGAVHEPVFIPLLVGCALVGVAAWFRSRRAAREGGDVPPLPGRRLLLALHALVLLQLVPLPLPLLRFVSPGSHAHWTHVLLDPSGAWRPISVSPPDTLRGLAFVAGFSLLFLAVFHELGERPWRRRSMLTVVLVGLAITVIALVQSVSPEPRRIYGIWRPRWDWAVFGPYVNGSHFAGYLLMATALAFGFATENLSRLRAVWRRRRFGFLALGDREGNAAIRSAAAVVVLAAGIVAAGSRGAIGALLATAPILFVAARHRRRAALAIVALGGLGVAWIGLGGFFAALASRGIQHSRIDLWTDMLPMVPRFPLFGTGLDAFSTAYVTYQTVAKVGPDWIGEAHNEYLQVLLDLGAVGAILVAALLVIIFRSAFRRAGDSTVDLGLLGALAAVAVHNLVDFGWQIPANAATWVALAALACRERRTSDTPHDRP